ncbi:unnamed protein product [Triticum turgidum subsp. durum]|uniref:Uncharacterized protein n=1 Tax=Triticum turgidum subsp. durum TaxID=4567 RepID=A0A9R0X8C2_TRITD|nr:unnamed protein product [Triticum turgidum subsp. durum]
MTVQFCPMNTHYLSGFWQIIVLNVLHCSFCNKRSQSFLISYLPPGLRLPLLFPRWIHLIACLLWFLWKQRIKSFEVHNLFILMKEVIRISSAFETRLRAPFARCFRCLLHKSRRNHPWQLRRALTLLCVYVVKRRDWRETVHFLGSGFSAHVIQMVTRKHLVAPEIGLQLKKPGIYRLIGVHRVPVQMHEIRDVAVSRTGGVPAVCFMLLHCRWTAGQFWSSLCILLKQAAVGSPLPSSSRFCRRHQSRMSKVCLHGKKWSRDE